MYKHNNNFLLNIMISHNNNQPVLEKRQKILIVEDNQPEGVMLIDILEDEGYTAVHVTNAEQGIKAYREGGVGLLLLDIMLPGRNGFQLAKQIKAIDPTMPIIFLTSKSLKADEIQGFTIGADDYLTKPYDRDLLLLRIKAVLKRSSVAEPEKSSGCYNIGQYSFDYKNLILRRGSDYRRITKREAEVLNILCLRSHQLVKREDILLSVWGVNDYFTGRSLDVFITKLRKYMADDPEVTLKNVHGIGYELVYPSN